MACICKDCGLEFTGKGTQMVILRDEIWKSINDNQLDGALCLGCMESRLGRFPKLEDLKLSNYFEGCHMPVNVRTFFKLNIPEVKTMLEMQSEAAMKFFEETLRKELIEG